MKRCITCLTTTFLIGASSLLFAQNQDQKPETKVSQIVSNGKYKRVMETFLKNKLISRITVIGPEGTALKEIVATKLFDNGKMTYASIFQKKEHTTVRSYFVNQKLAVQEGDQDGDGFYETLIVFDDKEKPTSAFHRKVDGTVTAFKQDEFTRLKKGFSLLDN